MEEQNEKKKTCKQCGSGGFSCGAYGIGIIGAAIYFIQQADTFWMGVLGVLKAIVWPAVLVYHLFQFLGI